MPPIEGMNKEGVFVFRTLDDTRALLERSGPGVKSVVIGGGLLGLEAARGLQVQGCDVTVVHLMPTLMERQLDPDGGHYLVGKMEELGVRVSKAFAEFDQIGIGHGVSPLSQFRHGRGGHGHAQLGLCIHGQKKSPSQPSR